jgi:glycosyltransferase involved in cell wall biosynthesis
VNRSHPTISTIIPVYNGDRFLDEAVRSVLAQRHPSLEIIIVDDGSTDRTHEIVRGFGDAVTYHRQENRGAPAARNKGLDLSRGAIIAFLDADDLWAPDKLSVQLAALESDGKIDIVLGKIQRFFERGPREDREVVRLPESQTALSFGSGLFRRSVFDRVGRMDEELLLGDDQDWFLRARERQVRIHIVDRTTLLYRRHDRNLTENKEACDRFQMRILKKTLDRRRNSGQVALSCLPLLDSAPSGDKNAPSPREVSEDD